MRRFARYLILIQSDKISRDWALVRLDLEVHAVCKTDVLDPQKNGLVLRRAGKRVLLSSYKFMHFVVRAFEWIRTCSLIPVRMIYSRRH